MNVFEMDTWSTSPRAKAMNSRAIDAAKKHPGNKYVVSVGEWGVRTYLVLAATKEQAKADAIRTHKELYPDTDTSRTQTRDVTNSKKYN